MVGLPHNTSQSCFTKCYTLFSLSVCYFVKLVYYDAINLHVGETPTNLNSVEPCFLHKRLLKTLDAEVTYLGFEVILLEF